MYRVWYRWAWNRRRATGCPHVNVQVPSGTCAPPKSPLLLILLFFLSTTRVESTPEQDCLQTIKEVYSSPLDLKNSPIENSDGELYMDRSSFVCNGKCMSGYAVTILSEVTESKAPMPDISAQKAELVALTQALELRK